MTDAWMPGAERIPAPADGGCLKGGAPRVVWLAVRANARLLSARTVAQRLVQLGRPCHLVWNPLYGDVAQLIPVVRAGRALGWPESRNWLDGPGWPSGPESCPVPPLSPAEPVVPAARDGLPGINTEGRVCVQIAVIAGTWWPFCTMPAQRLQEIFSWLDSWQVPRSWPAGRPPAQLPDLNWVRVFSQSARPGGAAGPAAGGAAAGTGPGSRRNWAQGGHFAAAQVPGCAAGAGSIDLGQLGRDQRRTRPARAAGRPARIAVRTRQPWLTAARSAAP
ncbi:MAG: hypothetical protein ACLPKI_15820 [Streptosporangiaceae bacterium]